MTERIPVNGDKAIVIRISAELHATLKECAQEEERPVPQVMRRALRRYVDARGARY